MSETNEWTNSSGCTYVTKTDQIARKNKILFYCSATFVASEGVGIKSDASSLIKTGFYSLFPLAYLYAETTISVCMQLCQSHFISLRANSLMVLHAL